MNRKIKEGHSFQATIDLMVGTSTMNLGNKNVNAGQNSLVHPALSTAGDFSVNGVIATVAASSTMFALQVTTVPAFGGMAYVCCLNAAGSGIGYASNVMTSAQVSTAGATPAAIAAAVVLPDIPATMCPVALYTVKAGSVDHISGSTTFSVVTSATGSHAYAQILNLNQVV